MDSDLSLIEIAGEDDSLLQPASAAGDAVSSLGAASRGATADDYFFCSPLQVPRSISKPTDGVAVGEEANRLFYRDSANKENFNVEKAETLKLNIEPQQMKRKKKGGGYNLRKSLAWDRAFFTEEGVLDATELSMISGSSSKFNGQMLSSIEEESVGNSSELRALEENLFKELPPTTSEKTKISSGSLLPKKRNNNGPTSVTTRKVLSTHDVNRGGSSRSACSRPVAPTSLKRPANAVTTRTPVKDSKVSRLPVYKPTPSAPTPAASTAGKNSTPSASDSKRRQITRPAVNPPKNCGLKLPSDKGKSVPNNSKAGPASKSSITKTSLGPAKRNVASSEKCTSTTVQSPFNTEAKKDLEAIPNLPRPSTGFLSNFHDSESGKIAIPLPENMYQAQIQTEKPTGLRRPSPSLGFFGQSKAPPVQSPLKLTSEHCNVAESNISNLRKLGTSDPVFAPKPPLAPRSKLEVANYDTIGNIKASGLSGVKAALHEIIMSNSQVATIQKVELKVARNDKSEATQSQNELQGGLDKQSLGKAGQYTTEATFEKEDITLQRNDECLLQQGTLQHSDKNDTSREVVDGSEEITKRNAWENLHFTSHSSSLMESTGPMDSDITDLQLAEDKPHHFPLKSYDVSSEIPSGNCSVDEPKLMEQTGVVNVLTHESDPMCRDSQMLQEIAADVSSNVQVSSVTDTQNANKFSRIMSSTEQDKNETSALGIVAQSSTEDPRVQPLDEDITEKSSSSKISTSVNIVHENVNDVTEKSELLELFPTRVEALQDQVKLHVDDCFSGETSSVPEEAKQENVLLTGEQEGTASACEGEPKSSSDSSQVPVTLPDCGFNMDKLVEGKNQEDCLVVENYDLDTQFQNDIGLLDDSTLMELGNKDDHLADVVAPEDVNASGQEVSNIAFSQTHIACGYLIDHTVEHASTEDIKLDSSIGSPCAASPSQPVDSFCPNLVDSPMGQVCVSSVDDDVNKQLEEEDKLAMQCFVEMDRISCEKKQSTVADGFLFETTHSLEEHNTLKNGNSVAVYAEPSFDEGTEQENLNSSLHVKTGHFVNELVEVNDVIKDQDKKNTEFQYVVTQTQDDGATGVAGVPLSEPSQGDDIAEDFNDENELVLEHCENDEIEKINDKVGVVDVDIDSARALEQHGDNRIEPKIFQDIALEEPKEGDSLELTSVKTEMPFVELALQECDNDEIEQTNDELQVLNAETDFKRVLEQPSNTRNEPEITTCGKIAPAAQAIDLEEQMQDGSLQVKSVTALTGSLETELSPKHQIENNKLSAEPNSSKSDSWENQSDNEASGKSKLDSEDKDAITRCKRPGIDKKQDNLVIKPPANAVPFSDEWLAAVEAAGEEILTMKSGAVQNSPQDRSQPEPGPWSPVKRKYNQAIGPFDCTKHTNH